MMNTKIVFLIIVLSYSIKSGFSQNILLADEAVEMAIENNFNIKRSQIATEIAKNNASKFNTEQLPTVALSSAANMNVDNSNVTFQDASTKTLSWIATQNANASVTASYTIFDGYFRKFLNSQRRDGTRQNPKDFLLNTPCLCF